MEELFLDREKILSSATTNSFEDWINENYDQDLYIRIKSASKVYTNTLVIILSCMIIVVALLTKPIVDAVLGLNKLDIIWSCLLSIAVITLSIIIPVIGYHYALHRAGEEWCAYRKLWVLAKKKNAYVEKRINNYMRGIK